MNIQFDKLKVGDIISETQHYTITEVNANGITARVERTKGSISLGRDYIRSVEMESADIHDNTVEVTKTELANIVRSNPVVAMTICFTKLPKDKSVKTFKEEVSTLVGAKIEELREVQKNKKGVLEAAEQILMELAENPPQKQLPAEDRIIKGYHKNIMKGGQLEFVDCEIENGYNIRSVNINELHYVIVGNTKYVRK